MLLLAMGIILVIPYTASAAQSYPTPISTTVQGSPGQYFSRGGSTNYDGSLIAFLSENGDLDSNHPFTPDPQSSGKPSYVYLRNTATSSTKLVSLSTDNTLPNSPIEGMEELKLSRNSNRLLFSTRATNITTTPALPTNSTGIYVYGTDINDGPNSNQMISLDENNNPITTDRFDVSDDGNKAIFVHFEGLATKIYVRDLQTKVSTLLPINGYSRAISGNGRYILYAINAGEQGPGNALYRYDLQTGQNIPVSTDETGNVQASTSSFRMDVGISYDGNKVAFSSVRPMLSGHANSCNANEKNRIYLRNISLAQTYIADVRNDGTDMPDCTDLGADTASLDASGNKVAFYSISEDLDPYYPNTDDNTARIFVHDFTGNTTRAVSLNTNGQYLNSLTWHNSSSISGDGQVFAFTSDATNISASNGIGQVYIVATTGLTPSDSTPPSVSSPSVNPILVLFSGTLSVSASTTDSGSGVQKGEFYIDTDPGQGNGTPMIYNSTTGKITGTKALSSNNPTAGLHTVYIRSKDNAGNWSSVVSTIFIKI